MMAPIVWRHTLIPAESNWHNAKADSLVAIIESRIRVEKFKKRVSKKYRPRKSKTSRKVKSNLPEETPKRRSVSFRQPVVSFDLNRADTSTLKKVYGIGPVLSERIVKFRDLLGGFTSKRQLAEVYGLKDSVLTGLDSLSFISKDFIPVKIDVNNSQSYVMDDHPYISRKIARAIDNYRYQHGAIDSISILYDMHLVDSATIERIDPYLKF